MSERIILIEPYKTYNDLIKLSGKVFIPDIDMDIEIPENRSLNLYNHELNDTTQIIPRNYELIICKITVSWKKDFQLSSLANLLAENENPTEVLSFRLQISCEKTRWCSEQKKIDISSINKRAQYSFEIPLAEVKNSLKVDGFITREYDAKGINPNIPESSLAILSTSKELSIQIDEIKEIGGEYLPIGPGNTGDLAFEISGLDNPFELPKIFYSEELKEFLTRDDLTSVNASMLTCLFYFIDRYLKWLIFTCRLDPNNKFHNSLVDLFSKYCVIPKEEIIELIEKDKFSELQVKGYLELSDKLFKGIQIQNKYKRELRNFYKSEKR
ncbi:MAG TPA: hypothetical protein VFV86_05125 [Nitrososphaeraceae archaeon]|nr:hypothetical protein [Nitrososphaeraceae archaeon]